MPSSRATKAPELVSFTTFPETFLPTGYFSVIVSQGFAVTYLRPSETRPA